MPEATEQAEIHARIKPQPLPPEHPPGDLRELVSLRDPQVPIDIVIAMLEVVRDYTESMGHLHLALDTYMMQRYPDELWLWRVSPYWTRMERIGTDEAMRLWQYAPEHSRFFLVNFHVGIQEIVGNEQAKSIIMPGVARPIISWPSVAWARLRGEWTASEGWTTKYEVPLGEAQTLPEAIEYITEANVHERYNEVAHEHLNDGEILIDFEEVT